MVDSAVSGEYGMRRFRR